MRKGLWSGWLIALVVAAAPVAADALPLCTPEEKEAIMQMVTSTDETLLEAGALLGDGTDPATMTDAVLSLTAISTGYWNETYPGLPNCDGSTLFTYSYGLSTDQSAISLALARLALYETQFGSPDLAAGYADHAQLRSEWSSNMMGDMMKAFIEDGEMPETDPNDIGGTPACTQDDFAGEVMPAYIQSSEIYGQLSADAREGSPDMLTQAVAGYVALTTTYWNDVYPHLPTCAEVAANAYNLGLIYDESLFTLTLTRLALYEADHGDQADAVAFSEAATARQELLERFVAQVFPDAEAAPAATADVED
jgi:hypothetical protein